MKQAHKFLILLAVSLLAYFPLLGKKTVNPDANLTIPALMEVKNPLDYFSMVSSFNTIDFQPTRDITFFLDIFIFKTTGIVSFATLNVLIWVLGGFFLLKILERIVPPERRSGAIFWVILFLVWPLFSQAVPWGMARKHVLAFTLILAATDLYMDWMDRKRNWIAGYLAYVAAALSHPLVLFWPAWAYLHTRIAYPQEEKQNRKKLIIFFITAVVILLTNYAYYTIGNEVVAENFWKMTPDYSNLGSQLMRLGFTFRQIIFPFQFGFLYRPELAEAWPGLLVFSLLLVIGIYYRKNRQVFSWLFFTVMCFPITLTLENYFDQYLILPAAGSFILLFFLFHRSSRYLSIALTVLSLGFGVFTSTQANVWTENILFTKRNYDNYPSCKNATNHANRIYDKNEKLPLELLQYLEKNDCIVLNPLSPAAVFRYNLLLLTKMMFYETDRFSREDRYAKLQELGNYYYFPKLIYATLQAEDDQPEGVEEACQFILTVTKGEKVDTNEIIQKNLRPYCVQKQLPACLKLTEYTPPEPRPY